MSKRRLFIADENSPQLNSSGVVPNSPLKGGTHPALLNSTNSKKGSKTPDKPVDSKTPEKPVNKTPNASTKKPPPVISTAPDSDSDSMEENFFFSKSSLKLPYTKEEDELILKYVLKGENIYKVSSVLLWKYLEEKKGKPKRTYQSLKNRFLRNIKPFLFSKYRHLIKDKETVQKIITKFPELKQQIGRKKTLTNLKLPERKSPSKIEGRKEEEKVSSTSATECQGNSETVIEIQEPDREPDHPKVQSPKLSKATKSNSLKTEIYERTVNIESDGISVLVNFKAKKLVDIPTTGIYEKFKKLQEQNHLVLCPTCGQYNLPEKDFTVISTAESDVIISNSVNTQKECRITRNSESKNSKTPKQKRGGGSDLSKISPCSPSLISGAGEASDVDQPPRKRVVSTTQTPQVPEVPNCTPSRTVASEVISVKRPGLVTTEKEEKEVPSMRTRSRTNKASNSSSNIKPENSKKAANLKPNSVSSPSKRPQDSDEEGDSLFEETVANFRKLISSKEERKLFGKCLKKAIGLEGGFDDFDSNIFESSSDLETPHLTIDYETDSQNSNNETEFESTSGSPLAENMRKMLNEMKSKSKKS